LNTVWNIKIKSMKSLSKIIILFFLLCQFGTLAQEKFTVEQVIAVTLKNNYDIRLVKNDSISYAIDAVYANAVFLPRVNANAGILFNNNSQNQELADGTKRNSSGIRSNNLTGSVQLNWTLFDGFKMFATRQKTYEFVKFGEYNVKAQMVTTIASVVNNYYNIVRQKQQLKAIEEQMGINEERVKIADKKLSVGLGAKPELLQAKVDLNAQKAARLQQQTIIEQLRGNLNQLMNIAPDAIYDVVDTIIYRDDILLGDLVGNIENTNPQLLAAKKNIDIGRLTLKERVGELYPTVTFNSAYNYSRNQNQTVINNFTPLFNQNNGYNYGVGVSIPILNYFNVRKSVRQAKNDIDYLNLFYENQRQIVNTGIVNAFKDYELQRKMLALEEENIILAKENVYIAVERLRLGISTYIELRETQKSLSDGYDRLIAARYNTKVAETELMRLRGDLVK